MTGITLNQAEAHRLAVRLHRGQTDKVGAPYIDHVTRVGALVARAGGTTSMIIAGYLHDSVEDTPTMLDDLTRSGVPAEAVRIVEILTRGEREDYEDFVRRCAADPKALLVKRMDVTDNRARLEAIDDTATRERLQRKYDRALEILDQAEGQGR